jgi:hypothetical protein
MEFLSVEIKISGARLLNTRYYLHQGRFSRPVFTYQGIYLSTPGGKIYIIQRENAGILLADTSRFKANDSPLFNAV